MGLLSILLRLGHRRRRATATTAAPPAPPLAPRQCRFEPMEDRRMLSASPLLIGAVYIEEDLGSDLHGDVFELSFVGGAPGTELTRVVIDGDQDEFGNTTGFSLSDVFFDTADGGYGADAAFPLTVVSHEGIDDVQWSLDDGTSQLTLTFSGFHAGEKLVFAVDVDEVLDFNPNETDLNRVNDGFDPITSGREFRNSRFTADFKAPRYYDAGGNSLFVNEYDPLLAGTGLQLSGDDVDGKRDRTAGTVLEVQQNPLPISIAGTVFEETNLDLVQDVGELGIANVTLELWQKVDGEFVSTGHTTTTDGDGNYLFGRDLELTPGTYQVRETQPVGYFSVGAIPGTVEGSPTGEIVEDDPDVLTEIVVPLGDQDAVDMDFAEARPAEISGCVYHDRNQNRQRDPGEEGIADVEIQVIPVDTIAPQSTVTVLTGEGGCYEVTGLAPGRYRVIEPTQPTGYLDWFDAAGTVDGAVVGAAVNPGDRIEEIVLGGGQSGIHYDFSEIMPVSIAGRVVVAGPEGDCFSGCLSCRPLPGVTVMLQDEQGIVIDETETDHLGEYLFDDLPPGTYTVVEITPPELIDGDDRVGTVDGETVGVISANDTLSQITLASGKNGVEYNFCEHFPSSLSGHVWHDRDNDGVREPGDDEEGIGGVEIQLYDADGQLLRTTETDADGYYEFTRLLFGNYKLVEVHPDGWTDATDVAGTIRGETVGTAINPGDSIVDILLYEGENGVDYDFGEVLLSSIGGSVHLATPEGDCFSETETHEPLPGVTVLLQDDQGNTIGQTTTDAQGEYQFTALLPGTYTVVELTPPGLIDGGERIGTVDGVSAGRVSANDTLSQITLTSGQQAIDYDFCEHEPASISGFVYHDRDNDGQRDAGEEGIPDVTLRLYDADGELVGTQTTDADGHYAFTRLDAGTYTVVETHPTRWIDGLDTPGTIDGAQVGAVNNPGDQIVEVTLLEGDDGIEYNFGELLLASISGHVRYAGAGGDCHQEGVYYEPLPGARVILLNGQGETIDEAFTDANGAYHFGGLLPGTYTVQEFTPPGLIDGGEFVGTIDGTHIGAIVANDTIGRVTLTSGQDGIDYDFCEHQDASITGFVYHDRDNDGRREDGEEGISGVTLSLIDSDGRVVATDLTDDDGRYEFTGLRADQYTIVEAHPTEWIDGLDAAGTIVGRTVGAAVNPGDVIEQITLREGEHGIEYNFGEYLPASISGRVHIDTIRNCVFDEGEQPLADVTVQLLDADGRVIDSTLTNAEGNYRFDHLDPGTYAVRELQPDGFFHGGQTAGSGGGDDLTTDLIHSVPISSGEHLIRYDFCEVPPSSISGYVFQDGETIVLTSPTDDISGLRDGQLTPDDTRLGGVVLELRNGLTGEVVTADTALPGTYPSGPIRTTTDANGYYLFTGLMAGNYAVFEVHPEGFIDSIDTPGTQSGIAFNPNEPVSPVITAVLTVSPKDDAIIRIALPPGVHSELNNFSEVLVDTPRLPDPRDPEPAIGLPPLPFAEPIIPPLPQYVPAMPPLVIEFDEISGAAAGYTWHLSVTNAGQPRSDDEGLQLETATVWLTGTKLETVAWSPQRMRFGTWRLSTESSGPEDPEDRLFGIPGGTPIAGDFNGDGIDEIGIFYKGEWFIDLNANGIWDRHDLWAKLGHEGDQPTTGDWDGDGKDDIAIFGPAWAGDPHAIAVDPGLPDPDNRPTGELKNIPPRPEDAAQGARVLKLTSTGPLRADLIDHVFHFGVAGDVPVTGDWNGDGITAIGIYRDGRWNLDMDGNGRWTDVDVVGNFGQGGDIPVVGDFNGDGVEQIGVYRAGKWLIDSNGNHELDAADKVFELGGAGDQPVVGDFNGDGVDDPAVYSPGGPRVAAQPE